jgi:ubiquinone/menaquinone biosynthesis C-methylase UbiE
MKTDQELFKGTAQYYSQYRVGYGSEFLDHIVQYFKLDGNGRLLDLGCGTGQIAIPIAPYFNEVVGLDPEQEMLNEAKKQATNGGVKNIKWVQGKAEDISDNLGTFRLVTIGAAFHWMDQVRVLEKVYSLIEKGGGLVIVYDSGYSWATRDEATEKWQQVARNLIKKYLGEKRRAGNSFYKKPEGDFDDLVEESSFGNQETWTHEYTRERDIKSILGFLYSTSFASRRLFGDKLEEFEKEFTEELLKAEPSGIFKEHAVVEAIIARKE